jgi:hypothetical protein
MIKFAGAMWPEHKIDKISVFIDNNQFTARIHWIGDTISNPKWSQMRGVEAIDFVMRYCPELLEGNPQFKFIKYSWVFHNLVAHPLMQILSFLKLRKLGLKIHDLTIPKPRI